MTTNYIKENNVEYINGIFENNIIKEYFKKNSLIISKKRPVGSKENNIVLNLSQCSRTNISNQLKFILEKGYKVIDYSISNIKLCGNYENHIYVPYQIREEESTFLKNILYENKTHDVCFVGTISEYRRKILNHLNSAGLKIITLENIYGIERDVQVAKCKVLLNMHFDKDHRIYESLRCDRWSLNGMIVITEESVFDFYNHTEELIKITNYQNLVNKIIELIQNYEECYKNYIFNLNKLIETKNNQRKDYLIKIM
jgi:hypothetical protein